MTEIRQKKIKIELFNDHFQNYKRLVYLIFWGENMLDKLDRWIELLSQSGKNTKQQVLEEMKIERFTLREVFMNKYQEALRVKDNPYRTTFEDIGATKVLQEAIEKAEKYDELIEEMKQLTNYCPNCGQALAGWK